MDLEERIYKVVNWISLAQDIVQYLSTRKKKTLLNL